LSIFKVGTNTKLGKRIAAFSLPAVSTCPGRTRLCEGICYATSGFFRFKNVRNSLASAYEEACKPGFALRASEELRRRRSIEAVRIHPSGDFFGTSYVREWIEIVRSNPNVRFWGYTRSWRESAQQADGCEGILDALHELSQLPNIELWASIDEETAARTGSRDQEVSSEPEEASDVTGSSASPESPPGWLRVADVVDDWSQVDSTFVQCPNLKNRAITCAKCTYCFKPAKTKKINVAFTKH